MQSRRQSRVLSVEETSRKKYDSDDSKRRLLRAALNTFSKVGYDAATTRIIAKQAGVNESLIHRYFKNKQGLFFSVLREFHRTVSSSLPYEEGKTVKEELTKFVQFRRNFSRENKKFLRLLVTQAILDPKVRAEMGQLSRNGVPGLVERLEKLRSKGQLAAKVDLEHLSLLLTSITFSAAMFTEVISTLDSHVADSVVDLGVGLLTNGLESQEAIGRK